MSNYSPVHTTNDEKHHEIHYGQDLLSIGSPHKIYSRRQSGSKKAPPLDPIISPMRATFTTTTTNADRELEPDGSQSMESKSRTPSSEYTSFEQSFGVSPPETDGNDGLEEDGMRGEGRKTGEEGKRERKSILGKVRSFVGVEHGHVGG